MAKNSLEEIKGVGPHTLKQLKDQGIQTVQALSKISIEDLAKVPGFAKSRAQAIISAAQNALSASKQKTQIESLPSQAALQVSEEGVSSTQSVDAPATKKPKKKKKDSSSNEKKLKKKDKKDKKSKGEKGKNKSDKAEKKAKKKGKAKGEEKSKKKKKN